MEMRDGSDYAAGANHFRLIDKTTIDLESQLSSRVGFGLALQEKCLDPNAGDLTYDQLPDRQRKEVDRRRLRLRLFQNDNQGAAPPP